MGFMKYLKYPNYKEMLFDFLQTIKNSIDFEWGNYDCCLFAAKCLESFTDLEISHKFDGTYNDEESARKIIKKFGNDVSDIAQFFAKKYGFKEIDTSYARIGDLLCRQGLEGKMLGICLGKYGLFVGKKGLYSVITLTCLKAWEI